MRRRIEPAVLILLATSAVIGVLIDAVVILESPKWGYLSLVFIGLADIPILLAALADFIFSPKVTESAIEWPLISADAEAEKGRQEVDQLLHKIRAKGGITETPVQSAESELFDTSARKLAKDNSPKSKKKPNGKIKNYSRSPEKLSTPAFICRCRHPHRFVCLECGMTHEKAVLAKKMRWVEWVPEMSVLR